MEDIYIRLAGIEKGGYYPYPPHMAEATASWFIPLPVGTHGRLLDPCSGEGEIASVPDDQSRVILATERYLGEGFDEERLDTLFLALPISWRGTLTQYAGRLHRLNAAKKEVIIYDYVDFEVPRFAKLHARRRAG